ncbi:heme ABC exporter ATP-binding protein CcmA [Temperatibacter marinus]|uniref:Heme ABC exporter ATP-binding protein CcmA n=1 Tax=Temperatibacter marinus TaxID=1456591 RepID=A0AA52HAT0_9PROT|nr:heme ABC exporter ATP-binding protein CcmA [Temperatibacter marinus]WND03065.1 heme ABC exporter ATP-binding protein CcmA [Temperatibacter marinus]
MSKPADCFVDMKDVTVYRSGRILLSELSLTLKQGQMIVLKGANGCGKSSLLRSMMGYLPFKTGYLLINQEDCTDDRELFHDEAVYLGHHNGLKPSLTLRENLHLIYAMTKGEALSDACLHHATDQFTMTALLDDPVKYFSSGQLRRAALCRFPLLEKPLWLMDEPTVGLDMDNKNSLAALMKNHLESQGSILLATHEDVDVEGQIIDLHQFKANLHAGDKSLEDWIS